MKLVDLVPNAADVEAMPLPDLAGRVLMVLQRQLSENHGVTCLNNFARPEAEAYTERGQGPHDGVHRCCTEAWDWLIANGLLGHHHKHGDNWYTLTRLGQTIAGRANFASWIAEQELPETMIHEQLRDGPLGLFRQGRLDTAVFEAYKTLEVAVRDASALTHDLIGTRLVARAFHSENGPLTDLNAEAGERAALLNLMSGAIGSYKNPHSHRRVEITAAEARELLVLASHLLRIVESRRSAARCQAAQGECKTDKQ